MVACTTLCLELAFQAALLVDYRQTKEAGTRPLEYREYNPLIRKYGAGRYFAAASLAHAGVTYLLPTEYKKPWLAGTIALEVAYIGHNASMGVKIKF